MNVGTVKYLDKYLMGAIAYLLGWFRRKHDLPAPKSVLFVQVWGIGETICTLPAIHETKKRFPKSSIEVLVTKRNRQVYEHDKHIDRIHEITLSPVSIISFLIRHCSAFDVVIDLEEYLNTSAVISFFTGRYTVGYADQLRSGCYDISTQYHDRQHVVQTYLDLPRLIGVKAVVRSLPKLNVDKNTVREVTKIFRLYKVQKGFIVGFGAGAAESAKARKWPRDRFAALADRLVKEKHATVVFFGPDNEAAEIDGIIAQMTEPAINLAGKTSVPQLFESIKRMGLFIGNDSGPMHIAAAQGVKTIGLFGPNLPVRFGPFGRRNIGVYKRGSCEFSPCINVHEGETPDCLFENDSEDYQKCMKAITVDDVMQNSLKVL